MEGDLLEVTMDEVQQLWQLLQQDTEYLSVFDTSPAKMGRTTVQKLEVYTYIIILCLYYYACKSDIACVQSTCCIVKTYCRLLFTEQRLPYVSVYYVYTCTCTYMHYGVRPNGDGTVVHVHATQ